LPMVMHMHIKLMNTFGNWLIIWKYTRLVIQHCIWNIYSVHLHGTVFGQKWRRQWHCRHLNKNLKLTFFTVISQHVISPHCSHT